MLKSSNFVALSKEEMKQVIGGTFAAMNLEVVGSAVDGGVSCQFSGHTCGGNGSCISSWLDNECCCSIDAGNADCKFP